MVSRYDMTVSTENAASPQSTKSRNSDSAVPCGTYTNSEFGGEFGVI